MLTSLPCTLVLFAAALLSGHDTALEETRRPLVGTEQDAVQVTYLRLAGSNRAIGRRLAEIGREQHGCSPSKVTPALRTRAQRAYFQRYFPAQLERMRGVADAFGADFDDPALNFAKLSFGFGRPGCTVAYFPPELCAGALGIVSRNFDFTTGGWDGRLPSAPGEERVGGRPYVMELWPDEGYASIAVCLYDLLGGVVDGMNSEGLVVALLADDEVKSNYGLEGARGAQAGFDVIQVGRFLLETCATAAEARAALLEAKLYFHSIPCHYLIADASGDSFIWENAVSMTHGYMIERDPGAPLVSTNFMHFLHPQDELPSEAHPRGSFNRHRRICKRVASSADPLTLDFVKQTAASVAQDGAAPAPPYAPARTLWHALYLPGQGRMEIDFYLGEGAAGIRRSGYLSLMAPKAGEAVATR